MFRCNCNKLHKLSLSGFAGSWFWFRLFFLCILSACYGQHDGHCCRIGVSYGKRITYCTAIMFSVLIISHNKYYLLFPFNCLPAGAAGGFKPAACLLPACLPPGNCGMNDRATGGGGKMAATQIITLYIYFPCVNSEFIDTK